MEDAVRPGVLERQLLLQFGDRLRRLRKARSLGMVEVSRLAGISRTTLAAVEAGDPGPSIGTYLRVMGVLGISGDLALLAGDVLHVSPPGDAASRSRRTRPTVQVIVSTDESRHQVQDLQSLALHEEAVRLAKQDEAFVARARATLAQWLDNGAPGTRGLWLEWQTILDESRWRRVLSGTRRAQQLRQASPLTAVLPDDTRQRVLQQVADLRRGHVIGASGVPST